MDAGFRDDVGIQAVAEVDRVDIVTAMCSLAWNSKSMGILGRAQCGDYCMAPNWRKGLIQCGPSYHSRSLYIIVKKT